MGLAAVAEIEVYEVFRRSRGEPTDPCFRSAPFGLGGNGHDGAVREHANRVGIEFRGQIRVEAASRSGGMSSKSEGSRASADSHSIPIRDSMIRLIGRDQFYVTRQAAAFLHFQMVRRKSRERGSATMPVLRWFQARRTMALRCISPNSAASLLSRSVKMCPRSHGAIPE
jgi:hypothetical protein